MEFHVTPRPQRHGVFRKDLDSSVIHISRSEQLSGLMQCGHLRMKTSLHEIGKACGIRDVFRILTESHSRCLDGTGYDFNLYEVYIMENIANNENPVCRKCGGDCCKTMGCEISPGDVIKWKGEISEQTIIELLNTGYISIDWWEGDPRPIRDIPYDELDTCDYRDGHYLRMRHINGRAIDPSYGGICVALTKHGCKLSLDQRPYGGRALVPNVLSPGHCTSGWGKREAAIAWLPWNDLLEHVKDIYREDNSRTISPSLATEGSFWHIAYGINKLIEMEVDDNEPNGDVPTGPSTEC